MSSYSDFIPKVNKSTENNLFLANRKEVAERAAAKVIDDFIKRTVRDAEQSGDNSFEDGVKLGLEIAAFVQRVRNDCEVFATDLHQRALSGEFTDYARVPPPRVHQVVQNQDDEEEAADSEEEVELDEVAQKKHKQLTNFVQSHREWGRQFVQKSMDRAIQNVLSKQ